MNETQRETLRAEADTNRRGAVTARRRADEATKPEMREWWNGIAAGMIAVAEQLEEGL